MGTHLAAIDGVDFAHLVLDEGMAALAHDGLAAILLADLDRVPDQARVIDDLRARVLGEERFGEEAHHIIAFDEAALFVKEEAAVEVAVPCHADVCMLLAHDFRRRLAVLLQDRVRHAVREVAVRLVVDLDEVERELLLERVDDRAGRAVARVRDDLERLELRDIDIGEDVVDVLFEDVLRLDLARGGLRLERAFHDGLLDVLEARVARNRARLLADELHAVVLFRVVAGRDHDAAVEAEMRRREVDHLRAALADVHDVAAGFREALDERVADGRAREADVMADSDFLRVEEAREDAADAIRELFVDVLRIHAADVVSAKAFVAEFHREIPPYLFLKSHR